MTSMSILDSIKNQEILSKVLIIFENIIINGAFATNEQTLHFPYFQIHCMSMASKGVIME